MTQPPTFSIVTPEQVKSVFAFGEEAQMLLTSEQTGGQYAQWIEITPPGNGPPPHYHTLEDEWFHVLEGRFAFFYDGIWSEVPVGTAVFAPKNSVHSFKNVGDTQGRLLVTTAPAGFEVFFQRCAEEFAKAEGPDMGRVMAISAEHGIHFVME